MSDCGRQQLPSAFSILRTAQVLASLLSLAILVGCEKTVDTHNGTSPSKKVHSKLETIPDPLREHSDSVHSVVYSRDGGLLISASADKSIRIWNGTTGKTNALTGHTDWVVTVAISPDGKTLASGSHDSTIKIWTVSTGEVAMTLRGHRDAVSSVRFSPDGTKLASASFDGTIRLWNLRTKTKPFILKKHSDSVRGIAFSPDGKGCNRTSARGLIGDA
jgi:WD40 repeat protein